MHPREFMACHYLIPDIVGAGCAAWSQGARSVGNDLRLEHETALLDVAAGLAHLRGQGFKRIVLLGNSGGAGLYAFYAHQSGLPAERIARTPGGKRSGLNELDMPTVDGMVLIGPIPARRAAAELHRSVRRRRERRAVGHARTGPAGARQWLPARRPRRYAPAFVERYREAQRQRVARLDEQARRMIAERMQARAALEQTEPSPELRRQAAHTPVMVVWRSDADLRCLDLSLDPSDRHPGSLWGKDPYASNYGAVGFARFCTPESWLSTWSGLSSNASLARTARGIVQPTLIIEYTGDQACFPSDVRAIHDAIPAADKTHLRIRGDHHAARWPRAKSRYAAGRELAAWLRARFL